MKGTTSRYFLAATLAATAIGVGAVMQYGPVIVQATLGGNIPMRTPAPPSDPAVSMTAMLPLARISNVVDVVAEEDVTAVELAAAPAQPDASCAPKLMAEPAVAAMVTLSLDAPCHADSTVTIHHNGMMFTEAVDTDGLLSVTVPALTEYAMFFADFEDGAAAVASTQVSSVYFYDRAAVQWQGDAGIELHAREFSDSYEGPGHVWFAAARDTSTAVTGQGGMMVRLGNPALPNARIAEIYTFPSGTSQNFGDVLLSVEAEVTAANCNNDIHAQVLQTRGETSMSVKDLTIAVPACDAVGDYLVLQNLLEDLKIAAK